MTKNGLINRLRFARIASGSNFSYYLWRWPWRTAQPAQTPIARRGQSGSSLCCCCKMRLKQVIARRERDLERHYANWWLQEPPLLRMAGWKRVYQDRFYFGVTWLRPASPTVPRKTGPTNRLRSFQHFDGSVLHFISRERFEMKSLWSSICFVQFCAGNKVSFSRASAHPSQLSNGDRSHRDLPSLFSSLLGIESQH